jgi:dipeptidase E
MKRRQFVIASALGSLGLGSARRLLASTNAADATPPAEAGRAATRKILIAGGGFNTPFIRYMAQLTGKTRPKLLYLPTASADKPGMWMKYCEGLDVEASIQDSFIGSYKQTRSWKAQGIDVILREAWNRGIVLGGASAGSLCWFEEGTTDSRPKELSTVQCLGFLKGSHSPHYDKEAPRRPLYLKLVGSGEMKPGYACHNDAGIYFEDNEVKRVVHTRADAKVFYVSRVGGQAVEKELPADLIA